MNEAQDLEDRLHLHEYPSAQAQDGAPIRGRSAPPTARSTRPLAWAIRVLGTLLALAVLAFGGLLLLLSNGGVSHEQVRSQVEGQLTALLGDDLQAKIGGVELAFGDGGILALDASDVRVLKDDTINLGVAKHIAVRLRALPLLRGKVVAKTIEMRGAALSLNPVFEAIPTKENDQWSKTVDLSAPLRSLAEVFSRLARNVENAGLEEITLRDTALVGFDQLRLRSREARFVRLSLERDRNFEKGIFFNGVLETNDNNWSIQGAWRTPEDGGKSLSFGIRGLRIKDLLADGEGISVNVEDLNHELEIRALMPFSSDGEPQQSIFSVRIGSGAFRFGKTDSAYLVNGVLNFRLFPSKNQIELERSPVRFETASATLIGGIRYPTGQAEQSLAAPVFQLIANDLTPYGVGSLGENRTGAMNISGSINPHTKQVVAESILLKTPGGEIAGKAIFDLSGEKPHSIANFSIEEMPVVDLKRFWPEFIAPGLRRWAAGGIESGVIRNASLALDFPPGLFGRDKDYKPENLKAHVPVFGAQVKSPGKLPNVTAVDAVIDLAGTRTAVSVSSGRLSAGKAGVLKVSGGKLNFGSYTVADFPLDLTLNVSGPAASLVRLGELEPLNYTKQLGVKPTDITGAAKARLKANFKWQRGSQPKRLGWEANVDLANVSSSKLVQGRKISGATVSIKASPGVAKIDGKAKVDGVPAKVALVERFGSNRRGDRKVTLTLDDAGRKRMGIDTGTILSGPVEVTLSSAKNGAQRVEANLRNARLNLPWIGWSKGKGINAKASFVVSTNKGLTTLKDFQLKGGGFSASGTLTTDKNGLARANLKKVILNKTDDFDVDASRVKGGYDIKVTARSYDGRSIINSFLSAKAAKPKGNLQVRVSGNIRKLIGFQGQALSGVSLDFTQRGSRISKAVVRATAPGKAPTIFALTPVKGGMQTEISTTNAGSVLRFLDLYSKIRGGVINANLVRDSSQVFRGVVEASNFTLLGEKRLAALLQKPQATTSIRNGDEVVNQLRRVKTDRVKIDHLVARIEKGKGFLNLDKGRLTGGDASAAFDGKVYDRNGRMNIKGTFLPGRAFNQLVSKIPIIGLAFGKGKVNGLLGITFRLDGRYGNPNLQVNPLSIIAPGVFRQIFKF